MTQLICIPCPACRRPLHIPVDWLGQPLRCKHCQQALRVRPRLVPSVPAPAGPLPLGQPALPAAPAPAGPFDFDFDSQPPSDRTRPQRRPINWGPVVVLTLLVLALASLIGLFFGPKLWEHVSLGEPVAQRDTPSSSSATPEAPAGTAADKGKDSSASAKPPADSSAATGKSPAAKTSGPKVSPAANFPRRALAISVCEYWFANPLAYGRPREGNFPGSSTGAVLYWLSNFNYRFPPTQLLEVSDQARSPHPPLKEVIEGTIEDFVKSCRPQDRIILLFAGHAVELNQEAYLVPLFGDLQDAKTLIPLSWVYKQLQECPARQKVLILDVCRLDPARGQERPGSEKMGQVLDAALTKPPEGVQVWSSCVGGQNAYEFENGSVFLQALCTALQERLPVLQEPDMPLPLDILTQRVNNYLAQALGPLKLEQTPRLSGKEPATGAAYNPAEPLPPPLVVRQPPLKGDPASLAVVRGILEEIKQVPSPRVGRPGLQDVLPVNALPPFAAQDLEPYQTDYRSWKEFEAQKDQYPLRAAVAHAVKVLQENADKFALKEYFGGASTAAVKKAVLKEQMEPGKAILFLEEVLEELEKAGAQRKKEKSKRWQAHYDFVLARVKARLIYLYQYDYVLAQIRSDSLPPLENGFSGYRLGSMKKVNVPESKVKAWVKDLDRLWQKIIHDYPQTPWELVARRERLTALGLQWRPSRE